MFFYIQEVISCRKRNLFLKEFLHLFSFFWKGVVFFKNFAYDKGFLKVEKAKSYVVSVGSVVAGGSGKTPFLLFLAKHFNNVAILSRGYRSLSEGKNIIVRENSTWREVGDEPLMFKKELEDALVVVGKKRVLSASFAEDKQIIFLDDGLQYRRLFQDFKIAVLSAHDLFGGNRFIPGGFLRDDPRRLREMDLVVINHVEDEQQFFKLKERLRSFGSFHVIGMRPKFSTSLVPCQVGIFSAIAKNWLFEKSVKDLGFEIVDRLFALDHRSFLKKELKKFADKVFAKGGKALLCTQKDKVKLEALEIPIFCVNMELELVYGKEEFDLCLKKLKSFCPK